MAYGTILPAVLSSEVDRFRSDPSLLPVPQYLKTITHLAAYWIQAQPTPRQGPCKLSTTGGPMKAADGTKEFVREAFDTGGVPRE